MHQRQQQQYTTQKQLGHSDENGRAGVTNPQFDQLLLQLPAFSGFLGQLR